MRISDWSSDVCSSDLQVCGLLREQGAAARLSMKVQAGADLPLLWADERLIRQILLNLVGNAIKFTPAGGRIVIRVEVAETGGMLLSVQDNGIGMSEADLERALIPFGQADRKSTRLNSSH